MRTIATLLLGLAAVAAVSAAPAAARVDVAPRPLVTVVRHGGLCFPGKECRSVSRITDTTVSAAGFRSRRLRAAERRALLRAIRALDPAYLDAHPFTGLCPTAYDGAESVYRFRGFGRSIASCRHDVRGIRAVRLTEQLLASLRPR